MSSDPDKLELEMLNVNIPYILNGELFEIRTRRGNNVTVKCCSCSVERMYRGSIRSTGNFHMHIKRKHPELLGKLHAMKVEALLIRQQKIMSQRKTDKSNRAKKPIGPRPAHGKSMLPSGRISLLKLKSDRPNQTNNTSVAPIDYSVKAKEGSTSTSTSSSLPEQVPRPATEKPSIITQIHSNLTTSAPAAEEVNEEIDFVRNAPSIKSEISFQESFTNEDVEILDLSSKPSDSSQMSNSFNTNNLIYSQMSFSNKFVDAVSRVEMCIKGMEREMRTRNQIETNRLFLDLAKFKHLHPNFEYQS